MADPTLLELTIDSLAAGGAGIGRAPDGRVVFVPDAAPGDRVRVRLTAERRRHAVGQLDELVAPGPTRVEPPCPVFGECGGCAWQHVAYPAQLEAKREILANALARIGKLAVPATLRIAPSPAPYAYRRRARLLAAGGALGFRRRRSHDPCDTDRCPILAPELERALRELAARPEPGEWELLAAEEGVRVVKLDGARAGPPAHVAVGADRLRVSPGVFVQSHGPLLEALVGAVLDAAGAGRAALELFAGAGFLTRGLARRFARVVAVESHRAAAADLQHNCAGLDHVEVRRARAEDFLRGAEPGGFDAVVLDPPRSGLPRGAAEELARLDASRIAMLSCDPATLARDLALLADRGYALRSVEGFDLFPQTPHVEALAVLERDPGR